MIKKSLVIIVLLITSISFSQKKWTLKEAVDAALKKNISIQQNKLSVEISKKNVDIAKGNFLPDLSASTSGNFNFGTGFDPVSQDRVNTSFFGGSFGANSSYTVFNGFRNTNIFKQAELGVKSSLLDLKQIENDISLRVVNTFLNVLFAKENLEVAKVQASISKKQIDAAKARFEAGSIAKGELLNIQSTAANDKQNLVTQENALALALLNLAQLLQEPTENFDVASIEVGSPSANLLYRNSSAVYEKSLNVMPEIARAKLAIENEEFNILLERGRYYPTVTASLGLSTNYGFNLNLPDGVSNPTFGSQFEDNFGYGGGFRVGIPIFNRFQTKNRIAQAYINKDISQVRLENQKLLLEQTIQQSFLDVKAALNSFEAAKVSLQSQREAYKNAEESYNFGATTLFDFDLIRNRLVSAESALIRAKYDYVFKTKVLEFYAGELDFE